MRLEVKKGPKLGDFKYKIKFAWLPTIAQNTDENNKEYLIWLCSYQAMVVYEKWTALSCMGSQRVIGWRTKEKIIKNN